ncbi:MAG: M23 family metallopeptidase [gamma proteobacterium symbiont of Taylorina sp.]|nr:M23 family metallopeptidase [gamma proteobacterium symbiont of Taylorina sp.]
MINIILIRKKTGRSINLNLSRSLMFLIFLSFLSVPALAVYFADSFTIGSKQNQTIVKLEKRTESPQIKVNQVMGKVYKDELKAQQVEIDELKQYNQEMVQSLMLDLGRLQAHIIRLDALGSRLVDVAQLDRKAFDFSSVVAVGGAGDPDENIFNSNHTHFEERIEQITQEIYDRSKQFDILEKMLINEQIKGFVTPTGKPSDKGWISSYFGMRKDPFSGKNKMHKGIDMAGKPGAHVVATADGVVIQIEKQRGYGKVLDIEHGYGLSTRYGHNKDVLVKVGDIVKQGQTIAIMGSTGRSTGTHVHYEVLKNGHPVNPNKYIITARKNREPVRE